MVTKTRFENARRMFPPGLFVRIMFKIGERKIKSFYMGTLILAFIGMGYKVLVPGMGYYNTWDVMTKVFFWIFVTMVPITIANFVAIQLNNRRIRKMCEYLNISLDEYKKCVDLWNIKT